ELKLPIRPLVLVPKTASELIIPLDTSDHQNLFELLRGLRQSVKSAWLTAIWHQEFASSFRCAFEQDRCLDFEKTAFIHENAHGCGDLAPQPEMMCHFGPAQIQIPVSQ